MPRLATQACDDNGDYCAVSAERNETIQGIGHPVDAAPTPVAGCASLEAIP